MSRPASEIAYLARALKAPRIRETAGLLASRAREEGWDYEGYLAAVLSEEVSAREASGGEHRVRAARFPQVKTLDDFDFTFQRSVKREQIAHLAQLDFLVERKNLIFLGPPGTGKTHLSIAIAVQAARRGYRVAFATAQEWVAKLADAKRLGRLDQELERLRRIPLLIVDEVGYIPLRPGGGLSHLRARLLPLRTLQPDREFQQDVQRLGGDLWRPGGCRRPCRPTRAPRRDHRAEGRQLPAERQRQGGAGDREMRRGWLSFQALEMAQVSTGVDTRRFYLQTFK